MALDFETKNTPKAYFNGGNVVSFVDEMSAADFDIDDIMEAQCTSPKFISGTEHFYSCAQHVLIGSYMAEGTYGTDLARAYLTMTTPNHFMGNINCELIEHIADLKEIRDNIGLSLCKAFGIEEDLWRCEEVLEIERQLRAIEFRDLKPVTLAPLTLPKSRSDIVINLVTPGMAYKALSARCKELFPELKLSFRLDRMTAEEITQQLMGFNRA